MAPFYLLPNLRNTHLGTHLYGDEGLSLYPTIYIAAGSIPSTKGPSYRSDGTFFAWAYRRMHLGADVAAWAADRRSRMAVVRPMKPKPA